MSRSQPPLTTPVGDSMFSQPALVASAPTISGQPQAISAPGDAQPVTNPAQSTACHKCSTIGARNLVVCIDGTSNQFSNKNTNVVELYSRLIKDETQLTYYNSGIGTYAKPSWVSWSYIKQVIANTLDLAFAFRLEKIIVGAYAWLVDNYHPGDRIFLFGFSRGAYQVRALAAMIETVGLLHKGNDDQIPFAYELYAASGNEKKRRSSTARLETSVDIRPLRDRISHAWRTRWTNGSGGNSQPALYPWPKPAEPDRNQCEEEEVSMQVQFKKTFSRQNVRVHFVGAWDTVSSVGLVRGKTLPATTNGMKCVCLFRHALALHEFRVKFLPEYVNGGTGPDLEMVYTYPPGSGQAHTKEVWFTGSHSDIGGGSTTNTKLNKFGPALRWMSWEAALAGLRLVETPDSWERIRVSKSMTTVWRILEWLPIKRLTYKDGMSTTRRPHLFSHRHLLELQSIHQSVYEECADFVRPPLLEEPDAYLVLRPKEEVLRRGYILSEQSKQGLKLFASSVNGMGTLRELGVDQYIYDMARSCGRTAEVGRILDDLRALRLAYIQASCAFPHRSASAGDIFDLSSSLTSETFPFNMCGHSNNITCVAFLSNTRLASGSWDASLRIWDVTTGDQTHTRRLTGYRNGVQCIAVCAATGVIASVSPESVTVLSVGDGDLLRPEVVMSLKDAHSGVVDEFEIFSTPSHGVAFSLDGSHLILGQQDGTIQVWNATTGQQSGGPQRGHAAAARSVAVSRGSLVVSGGADRNVLLWQWVPATAALHATGEPLVGHTDEVSSVAISPDARLIASGSEDKTVRLWDADTRALSFTLEGHRDAVTCVAFAPSGVHLASASNDATVRIWDAYTGAVVRVLRGHTDPVISVSFSPDGMRIASGSSDCTVCVWDVDHILHDSHCDETVGTGSA